MTTKMMLTVTITEDDNVVIEARVPGRRPATKVVKKDENVNTSLGEAILSFVPQPTPALAPPSA